MRLVKLDPATMKGVKVKGFANLTPAGIERAGGCQEIEKIEIWEGGNDDQSRSAFSWGWDRGATAITSNGRVMPQVSANGDVLFDYTVE